MRFPTVAVLLLTGLVPDARAQPPYFGTWAADYANSDRDEVVLEFGDLGSGLWDFRQDGRHLLHFRIDDDRECSDCASEPWRTIGPNAWDTGWLSGAVGDVVEIAPDGNSLSWTSRSRARDGEPVTRFVRTFERLAGGPGLSGQWLSETERSSWAPRWIEVSPGVGEWLVLEFGFADSGTVCILLLDGADYPCFAAFARPGRTVAASSTDTRALDVVIKQEGDGVSEWTLDVSPDGSIMTQTRLSTTGRRIRTVYNRHRP